MASVLKASVVGDLAWGEERLSLQVAGQHGKIVEGESHLLGSVGEALSQVELVGRHWAGGGHDHAPCRTGRTLVVGSAEGYLIGSNIRRNVGWILFRADRATIAEGPGPGACSEGSRR